MITNEKKYHIPYLDLWKLHKPIYPSIIKSITKQIKNSDFSLGEKVAEFEKKYSKFIGVKYCIGLSNGTDAIILALKALNINKGDEVLTTSHTWISAVFAINLVGAKPSFLDIRDDLNLNEDEIKSKITPRTKAIIVTHMHGLPCNMDIIKKVCKKKNIHIVEDCSQAHGSSFKKRKIGSFGTISTFSFYPSKNLGSIGESGCCLTNSNHYYQKLIKLRNMGQKKRHNHEFISSNYKMDSIQASVLLIKMKYLNKWNQKKIKIADYFNSKINNQKIKKPITYKDREHVYHHYVLRVKQRNKFIKYLEKYKIGYQIHYPNEIFKQKPYQNLKVKFFNISKIYKEIISIPCNPYMNKNEINYICKKINLF